MVSVYDDPLAAALRQVVATQETADATHVRKSEGETAAAPPVAELPAPASPRSGPQGVRHGTAPDVAGASALPAPAANIDREHAATIGHDQNAADRGGGSTTGAERRALESAALAMLVRQLVPLVRRLPVDALSGALSAADPTTAAASLTATLAVDLSARATSTPLVRAWLESARRKRELLEEAGGGLTAAEVAEVRDITRQAVERARNDQRLLAVPAGGGEWLFPAAQFGPDGHPLPGLTAVLRSFRIDDPWARLSELLAPDPELGDRSIVAVLREEGEAGVPAAVAALREVGEMGA